MLDFNYSISAHDVLTHPEMGARFNAMRRAGVNRLWLFGYFYGHHESAPEEIARARARLLEEGFATGVISLPVGHPGNSLDPGDAALELRLPESWRYRVDRQGRPVYFCADIEETMTRDNLAAAQMYAEMGFDRMFFDDDLRMGNWGPETQGCFCDECIARFNERFGRHETRSTLAAAALREPGTDELRLKWEQFNCDKVTDFVAATRVEGVTGGIMLMHASGREHGLSVPDLRRVAPDYAFRVGEAHFNDADYDAPGGRASLAASVRAQLRLIGDAPAYSESTVFPMGELSPANYLDKIYLELSLGLRHIFLMSGTRFLEEQYWRMLTERRAALEEFALALDEG